MHGGVGNGLEVANIGGRWDERRTYNRGGMATSYNQPIDLQK